MVKIFAATVSAAAYLYLQVLPCAAVFPHGILVQMTTILQVRVHEHVLGNACASALAKYSCYNAESQRAVRELRRPGGAKPHGEVRSMTIPAGGQVSKLQKFVPSSTYKPPATFCHSTLSTLLPKSQLPCCSKP